MSEQPEALRLADIMEAGLGKPTKVTKELRRLHEVNQELLGWLTSLKSDIAGDRKLRERFGVSFLAALESSIAKAKGESCTNESP